MEIEQMKVVKNASYAEAVKKVQEQRRSDDTDKAKEILRRKGGQAEENRTALTVDSVRKGIRSYGSNDLLQKQWTLHCAGLVLG